MDDHALAVRGSGMVTSVGLNSAAAAAAMRCRLNQFCETEYEDAAGEPLVGAPVAQPFAAEEDDDAGRVDRLGRMLNQAVTECVGDALLAGPLEGLAGPRLCELPLLVCVMEPERPGRPEQIDHDIVAALIRQRGDLEPRSRVVRRGAIGISHALRRARELLYQEAAPAVLVAAADSYLWPGSMPVLARQRRLLRAGHAEGFIPGEAAGALLLTRPQDEVPEQLLCTGVGLAREPATRDNQQPNLAQGLTHALRQAFDDAGQDPADTDLRLADLAGEAFQAEEATIAALRVFQGCVHPPELWLPAESLGATGAATGVLMLAWLRQAHLKDYAPGWNSVCHLANDDGWRAAVALTWA